MIRPENNASGAAKDYNAWRKAIHGLPVKSILFSFTGLNITGDSSPC